MIFFYSTVSRRIALVLFALAASQFCAAQKVSTNLHDYVVTKLDNFTTTMVVTNHNDEAGKKINKDFGLIYRIKGDISLKYKEPNKLRLDAFVGASKFVFIVNGQKQYVHSSLGLKDVRNLGEEPGKRKTLLDMGMISEGYLSYAEGQYVGTRPYQGTPCAVFRISYKDQKLDTSHRMVWIDPKSKVTLKREEYSQEGKLNATFYYKDPKEIAKGIWFPSRIEVFNNENEKAGETKYRNVKVNGLEGRAVQAVGDWVLG